MLKTKRIQQIQEYVLKHQSVSLDDLGTVFGVSKTTIRRDIRKLISEGMIQKVYGGVAISHAKLESFNERKARNPIQKRLIAKTAADYVENGDVIFIDSGTTTLEMITFLKTKQVTIITNNLDIIIKALHFENLTVISTGGLLERDTKSFSSYSHADSFKKYNFDKVFMASTGVSISNGVTNSSPIESGIKETIVKGNADVFLLVDHTKLDKYAMVTYCGLKEVDYLITDNFLDENYQDFAKENSIQLVVINE
ncbi:DeoR/GlpR family DNA-binding transcription regulator [Priestia megaterium]|uniref:DeoR/GlpR family DNA-binding transcription regulator n=1 Tax=Priestia megaterium TaxID=1404 RepID=UPI0021D67073|nr:DeoR/GlpR family DNA-binding transcription regulator [Priestia megaterium]MCU7746778.1 DeoR/GlpR family DNA-binding transcription regulator [Priestia megaterium]